MDITKSKIYVGFDLNNNTISGKSSKIKVGEMHSGEIGFVVHTISFPVCALSG